MTLLLTVLMLMSASTDAKTPVKGKLCFSTGECLATTGTAAEVPAHAETRPFVWTSEDSRMIVAGELPANETIVDLALQRHDDEPERRTIRLSLRGAAGRGWPADVEFDLTRGREIRWEWSIPAAAAGEEMTIHVPSDDYGLAILAPRHRGEWRRLRVDRDLSLGEVALRPSPAITGRVTRLEGEDVLPVEGAQLLTDAAELIASTNEQGVFRAELAEPVPEDILIVSPGLGNHVVLLEKTIGAENDLGEIRLESGVSLTLSIERPDELRSRSLTVDLLKEHERRHEHTKMGSRELAAGDDTVRFTDLPAGEYFVIASGEGDLERLMVPVEVGTENAARAIEIRPYRLRGTVTIGDEKLGGGTVTINPRASGPTWRTTLPIDSEGAFGGELWQTGVLSAFIGLPDASGGLLHVESPELGSNPSEWPIRFRKRLIHGRVIDAETGEGLASVGFRLHTTTSNTRGYSNVKVAPSGLYEILAWQDGTYDLIVESPDHLPKTTTVELSEADGSREIDIALETGTSVALQFVWPNGQPVAGAHIVEGIARDGHNPEQIHSTDAAGRLMLRTSEGASRLLHIIPREGSFATVRLSGLEKEKTLRIEVPPPVGVLRVETVDDDGNPAGGAVVMRYNGEWLPYTVTGRIRGNRSPGLAEFLGLPAGAYEVWAVRNSANTRHYPYAPPAHAPVSVGVAAGQTTIQVTVVRQ